MKKKLRLLASKARPIGRVRIENLEGRPHYVFKVKMWKLGTVVNANDNHNGGASYFPQRQQMKVMKHWDHRPVVINHPRSKQGKWGRACKPSVINKSKVGIILNNKAANGFQESEAWIDKRRIDTIEPRFKKRLNQGATIEVSTGCQGDCYFKSGRFQGRRYDQIVSNIVPDHLALLLDDKGACSCADGCGMFTAKRKHCSSCQRKAKNMKKKLSTRKKIDRLVAIGGLGKEKKGWLKKQKPEVLNAMLAQAKALKKVNSGIKAKTKKSPTDDFDDADLDLPQTRRKKSKGLQTKKSKKGKTTKKKSARLANKRKDASPFEGKNAEEVVAMLPQGMQDMFANGLAAHGKQRERYIDIIVSAKNSLFKKKELRNETVFPLRRLQKVAALAMSGAKTRKRGRSSDPYAPFMGAGGAPIANSRRKGKAVKQGHLTPPSIDDLLPEKETK